MFSIPIASPNVVRGSGMNFTISGLGFMTEYL